MKDLRQPEVNIGMIGHVDHGKTTLTQLLSGKWTDEHSEELKRGISIKLGYADATFYKCPSCKEPSCYCVNDTCPNCKGKTSVLRKVSFVDAPGHETLMAIMLSGAAIMDGAILVIAANEPCPQPQTREHLTALDLSNIKNIVIVQNKIDLVSDKNATKNYEQILGFVKGTCAENAPIIPISAHHKINMDILIKALEDHIFTPKHDKDKPPLLYVARSFDINKPGLRPDNLVGGVIGGSLIQGVLKVDDKIEIAPGRKVEKKGRSSWEPIITTIHSLFSGNVTMEEATPGGLLAVGTLLDPSKTKSDSFAGRIIGKPGVLPPVFEEIEMNVRLLERVVGSAEEVNVEPVKANEPLMLTIGTATVVGMVTESHGDFVKATLKSPACISKDQKIAISRKVAGRWRLIGYGVLRQ